MQTATATASSKVEQQMPRLNPPAPNGSRLPYGRPKGTQNKATRTIKEAIERACQPGQCHPQGLAGWLVERAQGGVQDRQIFATFVAKAIPAQLQASVSADIVVQLPWLAGRAVGSRTHQRTQHEAIDAQVVEAQGEKAIDLRVDDPTGAAEPPSTGAAAAPDPHPPVDRQAGGGVE